MGNGDYIKLHRSMMDWEWYQNSKTSRLFIHMLLKANWKEGRLEGVEIPRGSFVSSLENLSKETGLSIREVRTALTHLKTTGEVTSKRHGKFSVFTVNNYVSYQANDMQNVTTATGERQESDKRATTIEEREEGEERKNNIYTHAYEEFWKAYPRKKDKGNAFKKFNARLSEGFSEVEIITAAKKYASECKRNETAEKYIKHPSSFLSSTHSFLDYLEKEIPKADEPILEDEEELVGDDW